MFTFILFCYLKIIIVWINLKFVFYLFLFKWNESIKWNKIKYKEVNLYSLIHELEFYNFICQIWKYIVIEAFVKRKKKISKENLEKHKTSGLELFWAFYINYTI